MELFKSAKQWSTRPADERFTDLASLIAATRHYAETAAEATVSPSKLRALPSGEDVQLVGETGQPATLTHWSFGQFANRAGAPADYLRKLPASLAATNLNHGLETLADRNATAKLLIHRNGPLVVRAFTSDRYSRIWNHEVAERLIPLTEQGWTTDPLATDKTAESDIYASDHDLFVFLRNDDRRIDEPGNPEGLSRGVIVENSEVGASALRVTRFLYRYQCGNHIIWGAEKVLEIAVRHVGNILGKASGFFAAIREYADDSVSDDEAKIKAAYSFKIGETKDEVLDRIFGKGLLSRKVAGEAFDVAQNVEGLDGRTAWALAQGVTRLSQNIPFADRRTDLDRAAGSILSMAF